MIVEFNGLPGTGKSTIAKELNQILIDKGFGCNFAYLKNESRLKRYISYLYDGSWYLFLISKMYAKKNIDGKNKLREKYINIIIFYYRMYAHFIKECPDQVLIIDQGIIQGLISIAHEDKIVSTKYIDAIFSFLKKKNIDIILINCIPDTKISKERIRSRNTQAGRLDGYSDDRLRNALIIQQNNFYTVRKLLNEKYDNCLSINLDTRYSAKMNAEIISTVVIRGEARNE